MLCHDAMRGFARHDNGEEESESYIEASRLSAARSGRNPLVVEIARGALYLMLQNLIHRGETTHKGKSYPGEHPAILDQPLWDEVQAVLAHNRVERTAGARTRYSHEIARH